MTSDRAGSTLVVLSGGLDSAVAAYTLRDAGHSLQAISFDYGQRHRRELVAAARIAGLLRIPHDVVGITTPTRVSALGRELAVPHGHYAHESMKATVVPNRNLLFAATAHSIAVERGLDNVALGVHLGDHFIYPDCRPEFYKALQIVLELSAKDTYRCPRVITPLIHLTKAQIVNRGHLFGVPFELTWSCYEGGQVHCGLCGTCVERREAFQEARIPDPTEYEE